MAAIRLATVVFLSSLLFSNAWAAQKQQEPIRLQCTGTLEGFTDVDPKGSKSVVNVDMTINPSGYIHIDGLWGCTVGMVDMSLCIDNKVKIIDDAVTFFSEARNDKYSANTSFTLNRYSGRFRAQGGAISLAGSGAKWNVWSMTTELLCKKSEKAF